MLIASYNPAGMDNLIVLTNNQTENFHILTTREM